MKKVIFLFLTYLGLLHTLAAQESALKERISANFKGEIIEDIIKNIGAHNHINFYYNAGMPELKKKISLKCKDKPLNEILDLLFEGTSVRFQLMNDKVILYRLSEGKSKNNVTISGYIKDGISGESLVGANVFTSNTAIGTSANAYGFYSLTIPSGTNFSIHCSFLGYKDTTVAFNPGLDEDLTIVLFPEQYDLSEVTVSSNEELKIQNRTQMSSTSLTSIQIKQLPTLFGEPDLIRTIQLMPGVKRGSDVTNGFYTRGGGPDQNLVLLDGATIYNNSHAFNLFSVFNADAIKSADMIKGGFPARYGGRLSSVLDVKMKEGNLKKIEGEAAIGYLTTKLTLQGPIVKDKTSFMVSVRRTFMDLLLKYLVDIDDNSGSKGTKNIVFYDMNVKLNHSFSKKDHIYLSYYSSGDGFRGNFNNKFETEISKVEKVTDFYLKWKNSIASFRWNHLISDKLFANTSFNYSKFNIGYKLEQYGSVESQNKRTDYRYFTKFNSLVEDFGAKIDLEYYPSSNQTIKFGVGMIRHKFTPGVTQYLNNNGTIKDDSTIYENYFSNEFCGYVEDEISFTERFRGNIGLHASELWVNKKTFFSIQPRVSLRYLINDNTSLKASYASMTQFLHLVSNFQFGIPLDLWAPATDEAPPMRSHQAAFGVGRGLWNNKYEFSFESYYKLMRNVIDFKDGADLLNTQIDWQEKIEKDGKGYSYGFEFLFQKKEGKTTGWIGYTLSWTNRKFKAINNGKPFPYKYDRRHDLSIVLNQKLSEKIDVSATWVFATGNAMTFPLVSYPGVVEAYKSSLNGTENNEIQYYDGRNNARMPNYHRLDMGINFHRERKRYTRTWNISIYNAYLRKNPFFIYPYEVDGKRKVEQITMLGIIPSFSYIIKF